MTMLRNIIDFQIGMEYLAWLKFDFILIWKIDTNPWKLKTHCQRKSLINKLPQNPVLEAVLFTLYTTSL